MLIRRPHRTGCLIACLAAALTMFARIGVAAESEAPLRLAVVEQEPYAGESLPRLGYAPEVVRTLLERLGERVEFVFYPPERAQSLTESGAVDGWLPAGTDPELAARFALSAGFPGGRLGLLKRSDTPLTLPADAADAPAKALARFAGRRIGTTRAALPEAAAGLFEGLAVERVATDLQNLDKLAYGRVDLVLMDPYVAADLLALRRPHLIGRLEVLKPYLFRSEFHLGMARGRFDALMPRIDAELAAMQKDGTLAAIVARHGLATSPSAHGERARVTIGTVDNPDMATMQRLSSEFEAANPDISLAWRVLDEGTLRRRVLGDLALKEGRFDVVTLGPNEVQTWSRNGWLRPFDGLPRNYDVDDLLPAVRDSLTVEGRLHALPFYGESSMTYYRRDLLRAAGLSMSAHPSHQDIAALASQLDDPAQGVHGLCLRGKPGWGENMAVIGTLIHSFGGRWFDLQWRPQLDSPAWREAIEWYVRVMQGYGPPNATSNGYTETLALFRAGRCAIWIDATVAAGQLFGRGNDQGALEVGFADAPIAVTERGAHWLWTWALAVPRTSRVGEAAARFATWATSKDYIERVSQLQGWVAVPPGTRRSTYQRAAYRQAAPFADFVRSALETADVRRPSIDPVPYQGIQVLSIPEYPAIGHQVGVEIAEALAGHQSVDQALARAQRLVAKQMRDSGYVR